MNESAALRIFEECGALLQGHFVLTSGRHSGHYVSKEAVIRRPKLLSMVCEGLMSKLEVRVDAIVSPALGGIALSQWCAYHHSWIASRPVLAVWCERVKGTLTFRRGGDAEISGKRCLVVDDIATTGGSVIETAEAARAAGGDVVGAAVLLNRGVASEQCGLPFLVSLITKQFPSWEAPCPLCTDGVPINTNVGHGAAFLAARN